jgi:hypothetical protein
MQINMKNKLIKTEWIQMLNLTRSQGSYHKYVQRIKIIFKELRGNMINTSQLQNLNKNTETTKNNQM